MWQKKNIYSSVASEIKINWRCHILFFNLNIMNCPQCFCMLYFFRSLENASQLLFSCFYCTKISMSGDGLCSSYWNLGQRNALWTNSEEDVGFLECKDMHLSDCLPCSGYMRDTSQVSRKHTVFICHCLITLIVCTVIEWFHLIQQFWRIPNVF